MNGDKLYLNNQQNILIKGHPKLESNCSRIHGLV